MGKKYSKWLKISIATSLQIKNSPGRNEYINKSKIDQKNIRYVDLARSTNMLTRTFYKNWEMIFFYFELLFLSINLIVYL